jgi:hypothetical protein
MTNVLNQNIAFNKSHYLGLLGAVQLRKKIILFTQDVTLPGDVTDVMVTACGGGAGGGGGGAGKAYLSSTSGPGGSGGSGAKLQTAWARITNPLVKCEIGANGTGGQGGQQRISSWAAPLVITSTDGQNGTAGGDTKFIPYFPGTYLTFYGATQVGKGGLNTTTAGAVGNTQLISIPKIESSSGAGGNTGSNGAAGGDTGEADGGVGGTQSVAAGGGAGGGSGAGRNAGVTGGGLKGKVSGLTNASGYIGFFFDITTSNGLITGSNLSAGGQVWTSVRTLGSRLIVGGDFTTYQASARNRIASVSGVTGSLDGTWSIGTGFNGSVRALAVDASGNVIVGGAFTNYNGNARNRLVRLIGTTGAFDSTLVIGTGLPATVNALAVQPDGKILIGGDFTSYNGQARNRIARISSTGTIDTTGGGGQFDIGTGFNSSVNAIAMGVGTDAGKIYVGGAFTTYKGVINKKYIIRLTSTGAEDGTFDISAVPAANGGFNNTVRTIKVDTNALSPHYQKVYVGGDFTTYKGVAANRIIRLNSNGSRDATFNIGNGFNGIVRSIDILSDGRLIVGGDFTEYNNIGTNSIARINLDGTVDYLPTAAPFASQIIVGEIYTVQSNIDYGGGILTRAFGSGTSTTGTVANYMHEIKGGDGIDAGFGAGGSGGQGGAYFLKESAPGGRGGNGGQGYMILHYLSRFE